jgi:hypothetical protein
MTVQVCCGQHDSQQHDAQRQRAIPQKLACAELPASTASTTAISGMAMILLIARLLQTLRNGLV